MLEALFLLASLAVLPGWALLVLLPHRRRLQRRINLGVIPLVLGALYAAIFPLAWLAAPEGGFGSLAALHALVDADPRILLAGWLHWIAFDLVIATLVLWRLRAQGAPHALILVPVSLVFLAGPLGLLAAELIVARRRRRGGEEPSSAREHLR